MFRIACVAKFRREFSWACRTGCSPTFDRQQMSLPNKTYSQWRARDNVADTVGGNATQRQHHNRHPLLRFTEVMRRDDDTAAPADEDINAPAADNILA